MYDKKRGFTLIEILTVVLLISMLFVMFTNNTSFAIDKAAKIAAKTDAGIYEIAVNEAYMTALTAIRQNNASDILNYDFINSVGEVQYNRFANALNANLNVDFQVEPTSSGVKSVTRTNNTGKPYYIYINSSSPFIFSVVTSNGDSGSNLYSHTFSVIDYE